MKTEKGYSDEMLNQYFDYAFDSKTGKGSFTLKEGYEIVSHSKSMNSVGEENPNKYTKLEVVSQNFIIQRKNADGTKEHIKVVVDAKTGETSTNTIFEEDYQAGINSGKLFPFCNSIEENYKFQLTSCISFDKLEK